MEIKTVMPEDLVRIFQSKQDLYNILTIDCKKEEAKCKYSKIFSSTFWKMTNAFYSKSFTRREEGKYWSLHDIDAQSRKSIGDCYPKI